MEERERVSEQVWKRERESERASMEERERVSEQVWKRERE